ncbi:hypothetical protein [Thermodesulfatator atlanticus]
MTTLEIRQEKDRIVIPLELWRHIKESLGLPEDLREASRKLVELKETREKRTDWRKVRGSLRGIISTNDLEEEHKWEIEREREKFSF